VIKMRDRENFIWFLQKLGRLVNCCKFRPRDFPTQEEFARVARVYISTLRKNVKILTGLLIYQLLVDKNEGMDVKIEKMTNE